MSAHANGEAKPRVWNFGAGPAVMPRPVLAQAQAELLDYRGTGMSVMELSHRSKEYEALQNEAEKDLRTLLDIPSNYKVLWMQGGASTQFATVVMNLLGDGEKTADYFVTGGWSEKALQEAKKLGAKVNAVVNTKATKHTHMPPRSEWKLTSVDQTAYVYYCMNETVFGVEVFETPEVDPSVPLVCDASSTILSRPIDVARHAIVYAGAQKNIGPSGLVLVIIREDVIGKHYSKNPLPTMLDYKVMADNNSLYNTPPTWAIYVSGLVFKWLLDPAQGGLAGMEQVNIKKSSRLYSVLDAHPRVFRCPVDVPARSRMNVVFRVVSKDGQPSEALEKEFIKGAEKLHLEQLKGHRSAGGIRASIYNAMPLEGVEVLAKYMEDFARAQQA